MKYFPLKLTTYLSFFLLGLGLAYYTITFLVEGESIATTGKHLLEIFNVGIIIILLPIFSSWAYCEFRSLVKNRIAASMMFSIVTSIGFIVFVALLSMYKHGEFLDDALTKKGLENLAMLFSMSFGLSVALYLSSTKERY